MTTPETVPVPEEPEDERPALSLVKETPAEVEPEHEETGEELEDAEEEYEEIERIPLRVRIRESRAGGLCIEIWEVLDFRGFFLTCGGDVATGSKQLVNMVTEWVLEPDGEGAWKKILTRAAFFVVPGVIFFRLVFIYERKELFGAAVIAWLVITWIAGGTGLFDSKKRRKKKKKIAKKLKKKRKKKEKERQERREREENDEPEDDEDEPETAPEAAPVRLTYEEQKERIWLWIVEKIDEYDKANNGIQIDDLYDVALKDGIRLRETDITTFKQRLRHYGVKVGQVKIAGDNETGVNRKWVTP